MKGYNIEFAMSTTLSAHVVEEMIRKVVEEQTGKQVDTVEFNISSKSVGFDGRESVYKNVLEDCIVTFVSSKHKNEYSGLYAPGTK